MIRNQLAGVILVGLLACSALATCVFTLRWTFAVAELQRLQARSDSMTRTSALLQQLAADAVEYSRRHPEMQPLLNQLNQRAASFNTPPMPTPTNAGTAPTAPLLNPPKPAAPSPSPSP
jgi:hypothetical protein